MIRTLCWLQHSTCIFYKSFNKDMINRWCWSSQFSINRGNQCSYDSV